MKIYRTVSEWFNKKLEAKKKIPVVRRLPLRLLVVLIILVAGVGTGAIYAHLDGHKAPIKPVVAKVSSAASNQGSSGPTLCVEGSIGCPSSQPASNTSTSTQTTPATSTTTPAPAATPSVTSGIDCPVLNPADFSSCAQWCSYQQSLPATYISLDDQDRSVDTSMIATDESGNYSGYSADPTAVPLQTVVNEDNEYIDTTNAGLTNSYNIELGVHEKAANYDCYTTPPVEPTLFPLVTIDNVPQ